MSLEHCGGWPFWPSLFLVALNLATNEAWVIPSTLCSLRWRVGVFSTFIEFCIISFLTFLALSCFNLYVGNFLTTNLQNALGTRSYFWDEVFCKNSYWLNTLGYFCRNLHLVCLTEFLKHLCADVYYTTLKECV